MHFLKWCATHQELLWIKLYFRDTDNSPYLPNYCVNINQWFKNPSLVLCTTNLRSSSWLCASAWATRSNRNDLAVRGDAPPPLLLSPMCSSSLDISELIGASCSYGIAPLVLLLTFRRYRHNIRKTTCSQSISDSDVRCTCVMCVKLHKRQLVL